MLTNEQREARRRLLGSSDSPILFNLVPPSWGTVADLWLVKRGEAEPSEGNKATEVGDHVEPAILGWFEKKIGEPIHTVPMITDSVRGLCANLDGMTAAGEIVEAKASAKGEDWGDEGTDDVPERVIVQVHHQFALCPGVSVAWVPALLSPRFGGLEFRMYVVHRNEELAQAVADKGAEFMNLVRSGTRPDDWAPSLEVLKRVRRQPGKIVALADQIIEDWRLLDRDAKLMAEAADAAKALVISALGDAEAGLCPSGDSVTFMQQTRKAHQVKESTFRVLRYKAKKGG